MRFPVIGDISTKDGDGNQNARLTNMLAESKKNGTTLAESKKNGTTSLATVRPGLNAAASTSGNGNGVVCFGGELVNVFGATLGVIVPAEPDYTHIISLESTDTIWQSVDWVGAELVGAGGAFGAKIRQSSDDGETTSLVSTAPVTPSFPHGLINKNGQIYLLRSSPVASVYRDNSDYGATWSYVGTPAVNYPCCVSGTNIYGLVVGEVVDEESELVGFNVIVYTTNDLTSVTASTSIQTILGDLATGGYGCMTIIDGVFHVLVSSTINDLLYHFKYSSGSWSYTTQAFINNEFIPPANRCYAIGGKIYFITFSYPTYEITLRRIDANDDTLETYYALGAVSVGSVSQQLIYNGTTLSVCLGFSESMEYHHFTNISSYEYNVVTTAALNEDDTYDFALIP